MTELDLLLENIKGDKARIITAIETLLDSQVFTTIYLISTKQLFEQPIDGSLDRSSVLFGMTNLIQAVSNLQKTLEEDGK